MRATYLRVCCLALLIFCSVAVTSEAQHRLGGGGIRGYVPRHRQLVKQPSTSSETEGGEQEGTQSPSVALASHTTEFDPLHAGGECADGSCLDSGFVGEVGDECGSACGACSGCFGGCGHQPRFWGGADFLLWWTSESDTPPLATTSAGSANQPTAGVLGATGTSTLFGGDGLHDGSQTGGRYTIGTWIDPWLTFGIEFTYLTLGDDEEDFAASEADFPVLARPFFNVVNNAEDARLIAFPGLVSGNLSIASRTEFDTLEGLLVRRYSQIAGCRVDCLLGYRGAELDEQIRFQETTLGLSGPAQDATIVLNERFEIDNEFRGGQFGFRMVRPSCTDWSWEFTAKLGLGNTNKRAVVRGVTSTTDAAGTTTGSQAGLLAQGTNIRTLEQDDFTTFTEIGFHFRRYLLGDLTFRAGYTMLYWSDVVRAGDMIDRAINTSQIPPGTLTGDARPNLSLDGSSFFAHGVSFGLEYMF